MLKRVLLSVAVVSAMVPAFAADIVGKWQIAQEQNGYKYTLTLGIEKEVSHFGAVCEFGGHKAEIGVDVPSKIDGNNYHVLGSAEKKAGGQINCEIAIKPMQLTYEVTDTQLTLKSSEGVIVLNKVQ